MYICYRVPEIGFGQKWPWGTKLWVSHLLECYIPILTFPREHFKPNPSILGGLCQILDFKSIVSSGRNRFLAKIAVGD